MRSTKQDQEQRVLRLREMHQNAEAGKCYTLQEIADYCGLTKQGVREWEQNALKRVRHLLGRSLHAKLLGELKESLGAYQSSNTSSPFTWPTGDTH